MGLQSSLFAGVAGLNANGETISIIGDNIANTNTVGFKASRPEFVDVLSGSLGGGGAGDIGAGSRLSAVNQNFTQGSLESTGVTTDLAIDGGGFFIVQDTTGVFYSRTGIFRLNENQILVNAQDQSVLGFSITPSGVPSGALGAVDLSTVASVPSQTSIVTVNVNLDPNDTAIAGGAAGFDHTDPVTTSNFQTGIRIFDSLGNARNMLIYFRKDSAASNSWFWYAGVNRSEVNLTSTDYDGGVGEPNFSTYASTPASQFFPLQSGTLTFDGTGALTAETATGLSIAYDSDGDGTAETAGVTTPNNWSFVGGSNVSQAMVFDFGTTVSEGGQGTDKTSQFGGSASSGVNSFVRFMNQNGFTAGSPETVVA